MDIYKLRYTLKIVLKVFRRYRWQFVLMTGLGFLAGIFGSIGIGAMMPLFLTLMVLLFILKALTTFFASFMSVKFSAQYEKDARANMFDKIVNSSWLHLIEQKPGYIDRVLMNDITSSSSVLMYISNIILALASLTTYIIVAINISTPITLTTLLVGAIIFFALKPLFYRTRKITEKMTRTEKTAAQRILEALFGMKIIKSLNAEKKVIQLAEIDFKDLEHRRIQSAIYHNILGSFMEPIGITFIAVMFLFSYRLPVFNVAAFAAIVYMVQKMFSFIQAIQGKINAINGVMPYLQVMLGYWEEALKNQETDESANVFSFKDKIE